MDIFWWIGLIFAIVAVVLLILIFPLTLRIMAHGDVLHNHVFFAVRALRIPAFSGSLKVHGNLFYITTKKGERALKIVAPATDKDAIASYMPPGVFPKINLHKLNVYTEIGKSDDAFFSAMALGSTRAAVLALSSVLRAKFPNAVIDCGFEGVFNVDHLQVTLNCILSISIANIINVVVRSWIYHAKMIKKGAKLLKQNAN